MQEVSRKPSLNIPKTVLSNVREINSIEDEVAAKKAIALAEHKKFDHHVVADDLENRDKEWQRVSRIPENANDLIAITVVKKLGAYVIAVTQNSPAKYRGVFVNRMQNFCLEALEELLRANFIRLDKEDNKICREKHQLNAIVKLKMLGYIAMVAENSGCILLKQYKQISIQTGEAINLIVGWKKSDDNRWRKKIKLDLESKGF